MFWDSVIKYSTNEYLVLLCLSINEENAFSFDLTFSFVKVSQKSSEEHRAVYISLYPVRSHFSVASNREK